MFSPRDEQEISKILQEMGTVCFTTILSEYEMRNGKKLKYEGKLKNHLEKFQGL